MSDKNQALSEVISNDFSEFSKRSPETPASAVPHESKFKANAWHEYSIAELGQWVHLLAARAEHRSDEAKRLKDLTDAQNYLDMMQSRLNELKKPQ